MTDDTTADETDDGYVTVEYSKEEKRELYGIGATRRDSGVAHRTVIGAGPLSRVVVVLQYFSNLLRKILG